MCPQRTPGRPHGPPQRPPSRLGGRSLAGLGLLVLAGLAPSCSSARVAPLQPGAARSVRVVERGHELGAAQLVPAGAVLARVRDFSILRYPAAWATAVGEFTLSSGQALILVHADQRLRVRGSLTRKGRRYTVIEALDRIGRPLGVLLDEQGLVQDRVVREDYVIGFPFHLDPPGARMQLGAIEELDPSAPYRALEVVYEGLDAGDLRLLVREYAAPEATRPPRTRELRFPRHAALLDVAGLRVRVHGVTPEGLTCTVLSDGAEQESVHGPLALGG